MSQKPFLLFLLVIIIVAVAAVAGIFSFAQGSANNRRDMLRERTVELASFSQQWVTKPEILGGGGSSFANIDIWKVTGRAGSGDWYDDGQARFMVEALDNPAVARIVAEDRVLEVRFEMEFTANTMGNVQITSVTIPPNETS